MNQEEIDLDRNESINSFLFAVQELMGEHQTEALTNADLIQELMNLSISNAYIFAEDPDQVDWNIRLVKKESLKRRKEIDDAFEEKNN
tara:strand:- start:5610 stop:5873 length:264 start_codon:yes stop_codon:yes gene_type:complete